MKVLVIGNLGYVGPMVVKRLRNQYPDSFLAGFDIGYFEHTLTTKSRSPEIFLDCQHYGDVRKFPENLLRGVDSVVYLAAISNDPMGERYNNITEAVNHIAAINIARQCKDYGIKTFVYASSCSVYGLADKVQRNENSSVAPLTAYARSKINAENGLASLATDSFVITCLRFATACGFSPRLRLDLVLNDFVASAVTGENINILSDGTPWRPLIHVKDMARAIEWGTGRVVENGGEFLIVNAGSNEWNYQVHELANGVKSVLSGIDIRINEDAAPDNRSYKVDFSLFKSLAPKFYPEIRLTEAIKDIVVGLRNLNFNDTKFRNSNLIRLNVLNEHRNNNRLDDQLRWII